MEYRRLVRGSEFHGKEDGGVRGEVGCVERWGFVGVVEPFVCCGEGEGSGEVVRELRGECLGAECGEGRGGEVGEGAPGCDFRDWGLGV